MESFLIFSLIRISAALLIFKWPLPGILLSALLDGYDWDFLHTSKDFSYDFYQTWDKVMDMIYLTIAAVTVNRWKDILAKKIAVFFYFLRASGVLLFFIFNIKPLLFFFPNVFENFFIWSLIPHIHSFTSRNPSRTMPFAMFANKLMEMLFLEKTWRFTAISCLYPK